jgi:hypothetical protein
MSTTQDIVDSLIDHIDKAITKGSVTNQQLAGVLDFLNERYKTLAKAGGSLSKDIRVTSPKTGNINPGTYSRKEQHTKVSSGRCSPV